MSRVSAAAKLGIAPLVPLQAVSIVLPVEWIDPDGERVEMSLPSASELNRITDDQKSARLQAELARQARDDQAMDSLKRAFQSRELAADVSDRINLVVRAAAERGEREVLVLRFPSSFCTDGGRRINNSEDDWPESLDGFARTAFDYYERELRPLDFTLRAQIIDFRDGMPGDVGLYLRW